MTRQVSTMIVALVLVVAVIVLLRTDEQGSGRTAQAPAEVAPLAPDNETLVAMDRDFREECLGPLRGVIPDNAYTAVMLTESKVWGRVLRADYTAPDLPGTKVNRVVCSRNADGRLRTSVSFAQDLAPLDPTTP